jgi:TPP-dependent pyruvate/acetoin dehydrogenase alpha subunit
MPRLSLAQAVGAAYSLKLDGKGKISVVYFGEGKVESLSRG